MSIFQYQLYGQKTGVTLELQVPYLLLMSLLAENSGMLFIGASSEV